MDQNGVRPPEIDVPPPKVVTHHLAMTFRQRNKVFFICNKLFRVQVSWIALCNCSCIKLH